MDFLERIQNLPERRRKIILWAAVIIIAFVLLNLWVKNLQKRFKGLESEEIRESLKPPSLGGEFEDFSEIEMPKIKINENEEEQ